MVHPHRQCGEEGATVPLQTQEAENNVACHPKPSLGFTSAHLRASCRAVSPPGTATCTAHNRNALQRVVRSAQRITGGKLPALQDTYSTQCHRKGKEIIKDINFNHLSHCLFTPLPSRRRGQYRCIKAGTERLKNSFYLQT